jgi:hypothetical protein
MAIKFWRTSGKYGCFSNFSKHSIKIWDRDYPTSEHLYQALKATNDEDHERIRLAKTAKECKQIAYSVPLNDKWDVIKIKVMKDVVRLKMIQNSQVKQTLLESGDELLVEDSPYDSFWGCGKDGNGANMLGKILMELRKELRNAI